MPRTCVYTPILLLSIFSFSACGQNTGQISPPVKTCTDILVSENAQNLTIWNPLGSHAILRDPLTGLGKLLELKSGKLSDDQDYLSFSPNGSEVIYRQRNSVSYQPGLGLMNLSDGQQQALALTLPETRIADEIGKVFWPSADALYFAFNAKPADEAASTEARFYRYNPLTKTQEQILAFPTFDPNVLNWQLFDKRFYFTRGRELVSIAAGETSPRIEYTAPENVWIDLLDYQSGQLAISLTDRENARLLLLDQATTQTREIASSRDRLEIFGPAAFQANGELVFVRRQSIGWDELRKSRLPFYRAEIFSQTQPSQALLKSDSNIGQITVLRDDRVIYTTAEKISEIDLVTGQTKTPERCK